MSLGTVKAQLASKFGAIAGVKKAYEDKPKEAPAILPAVIFDRRKPFLTPTTPFNDTVRYTWHFQVLFLYATAGAQDVERWDAGIEGFPALCVAKVLGALTLGGTIRAPGLGGFNFGLIPYLDATYFGFTWDLDATEDTTVQMVA